ncbi:hypothetical protein T484DRAFT_2027443 [Baffinella frigidus]|nr:hypothetical protein T484DRAFT_2027443 [Cryptophyta sp. CCMP2293]
MLLGSDRAKKPPRDRRNDKREIDRTTARARKQQARKQSEPATEPTTEPRPCVVLRPSGPFPSTPSSLHASLQGTSAAGAGAFSGRALAQNSAALQGSAALHPSSFSDIRHIPRSKRAFTHEHEQDLVINAQRKQLRSQRMEIQLLRAQLAAAAAAN